MVYLTVSHQQGFETNKFPKKNAIQTFNTEDVTNEIVYEFMYN